MTDTTLKIDELKKIASAELGYQASIVIGGSDPEKFVPNVNSSFKRKTSDEYFININARDVVVSTEVPSLSDISEITTGDRTDKYYINEDGTLEYEIILAKKPLSNIVSLDIQCSPGLEFYHQAELTLEEITDGCQRPDDIINSYAIYCDKAHNQYQTGKVAHIKRSYVIDVDGIKSWCNQNVSIDNGSGVWTIEIPSKIWSDPKKYPLKIGPSVGYTSVGGSNYGIGNIQRLHVVAAYTTVGAVNGTTDSIWMYISDSWSKDSIGGWYASLTGSPSPSEVSAVKSSGWTDDAWNELPLGGAALTANQRLYPTIALVTGTGNIKYDTGSSGDSGYIGMYSDPPELKDPLASYTSSAYRVSYYLEYTETAGPTEQAVDGVLSFAGAISRKVKNHRILVGAL